MYIPNNNIFKWIGGKKWLSNDIKNKLKLLSNENHIETYIEPFTGGLGSFKSILPTLIEKNVKTIILNDINTLVVNTFINIKNNIDEFKKEYLNIENDFRNQFSQEKLLCKKQIKINGEYKEVEDYYHYFELNKTRDKEQLKNTFLMKPRDYFNKVKKNFNESKLNNNITIKTTAQFLFIMQNCFNGVYRENKKGEFNIPYNWNSTLSNLENKIKDLEEYNILFNQVNITFSNKDVFELLEEYKNKNNIFIYLDPPYLNIDGGENKYNKDHFGYNEQIKLLNYTKDFKYVLYSNHNHEIIKDFFNKEDNVSTQEVFRKNIMSSSNASRQEDKSELLIFKY